MDADDDVIVKEIPTFDPIKQLMAIGPQGKYVFTGRSGSGKSVGARALFRFFAHELETVVSFVPTSRQNKDPSYFVPPAFDFYEWDEERMMNILDWYTELAASGSKRNVMFYFDDCNAEVDKKNKKINIYHSAPVVKLQKQGRHEGCGGVIAAQNVLDLPPSSRNMAQLICVFACSSSKETEAVRSNWADHCPSKVFAPILANATAIVPGKPRTCLVINVLEKTPENPFSGLYVWAPPWIQHPFVCGRPEYYKLSIDCWKTPPQRVLDPWAVGGKDPGPSGTGGRGGGGGRGAVVRTGGGKKKEQQYEIRLGQPVLERFHDKHDYL